LLFWIFNYDEKCDYHPRDVLGSLLSHFALAEIRKPNLLYAYYNTLTALVFSEKAQNMNQSFFSQNFANVIKFLCLLSFLKESKLI